MGEPVQKIEKNVYFKTEYIQLNDESLINDTINSFIRPFELNRPPLMRVMLIRIPADKERGIMRNILVLDIHHIISDGVSMAIFIREFMELYHGRELPELRLQYKDYSAWHNERLVSEEIKRQEKYWLEVFKYGEDIPVLDMPTDFRRSQNQSLDGEEINFRLDRNKTQKLKQIMSETGTTLYMLLMAAYNVLLSRYTGSEDIVVGCPVAGRLHADLENIMGMFVNTLAIRNYPKWDYTFPEFLQAVRDNVLLAYENQEYQYEELVAKLNIQRGIGVNTLIGTIFTLQNTQIPQISIDNLTFDTNNFTRRVSKFDLELEATEYEEEIYFNLLYCKGLFKRDTADRIIEDFLKILDEIVADRNIKIKEIDLGRDYNIVEGGISPDEIDFKF